MPYSDHGDSIGVLSCTDLRPYSAPPMTPTLLPRMILRATPCRLPGAACVLAVALLVSGCTDMSDWDREYACGGQEESSAWYAGDTPEQVTRKQYSAAIDLHLRSGQVMVRTYQTPAVREGQRVSFSARSASAWLSGQFDRQAGELSLIEERTLDVMGRSQQIRTSGHYRCQPVSPAPRTT